MKRQDRRLRAKREPERLVQRKTIELVQIALIWVTQQLHAVYGVDLRGRGNDRLIHRFDATAIGELFQKDLLHLWLEQKLKKLR